MRSLSSLGLAVAALASIACGTEPAPQGASYVTELALTQVEADLGPGAKLVRPDVVNTDDDGCSVDGVRYSLCAISDEQPPELHVPTTLCELNVGAESDTRFFVECRRATAELFRPAAIPHCPGHG